MGGAKPFKTGGELDIKNYAIDYEGNYSHAAPSAVKTDPTAYNYAAQSGPFIISRWTNDDSNSTQFAVATYGRTGQSVVSNLKMTEAVPTWVENLGEYPILRITRKASVGGTGVPSPVYEYYDENGKSIVSNNNKGTSFKLREGYVNGEKSDIIIAKPEDYSEIYLKATTDDNGAHSYETVSENDVSFVAPEYADGASAFSNRQPVYSSKGEHAVADSDLLNYSYAKFNDELVFYNGTDETSRLSVDNVWDAPRFVGNYMYYTKQVLLSEDSKKANATFSEGGLQTKYDYSLHRYDFTTGKDKTVNCDVFINTATPLYNKTEKAYDAILLKGNKIVDGIVQENAKVTYILDSELNVAYDLGDASVGDTFYALDDSHYLTRNVTEQNYQGTPYYTTEFTVFNKDMQVISRFTEDGPDEEGVEAKYYSEEKLFAFSTNSGTGFADLDGKVVIDPVYTNVSDFYGGYALATNSVTGKTVFIKSDGTETAAPENSADERTIVVYPSTACGWFYKLTYPTVANDYANNTYYQLEICGYNGNRIGAPIEKVRGKDASNPYNDFKYTVVGKTVILPIVDSEDNVSYRLAHIA